MDEQTTPLTLIDARARAAAGCRMLANPVAEDSYERVRALWRSGRRWLAQYEAPSDNGGYVSWQPGRIEILGTVLTDDTRR